MLNLLDEKIPLTQKYLLLDSLSQRLVTESQTVHFTLHWFNLMMTMMISAQMIQTQCLETEPTAWHGSTVSSVTCHVSRTLFFTFISSAFNPVQERVHLICTWIDNVPTFYTVILFIFHFIYFMIRLQLIHFHSQSPSLLFSPSVTNTSSAITRRFKFTELFYPPSPELTRKQGCRGRPSPCNIRRCPWCSWWGRSLRSSPCSRSPPAHFWQPGLCGCNC